MADALLGGIVINEILVDPNGSSSSFDTDGNGTSASTDEYVELYNTSTSAIDISGLELWDAGAGNWFTFPTGSILQPGAHALVLTGVQSGGALPTGGPDDLFFDAGRGSAVINNGGDNLTLYDPANDEYIQATFNGDAPDDPTAGAGGYSGFSATATQIGSGEDFGSDTDGQSLQRSGNGADTFTSDAPTPGVTNVCFAGGTVIETPDGPVNVEDLTAGDTVLTLDQGVQVVMWVYGKSWTAAEIKADPQLAPVRVKTGSLGDGLPWQDLLLSRQHRVLVRGPIAQRMFGTSEVLAPAKDLLDLPGVAIDGPPRAVNYHHLALSGHEIVLACGMPCESLFLGAEALRSIPKPQLDDLLATLGMTRADLTALQPITDPIRPMVKGKVARSLVARHLRNRKPLFSSDTA